VKSLLRTRYERIGADSVVMVLNPAGDLRFSSLECAWVKQTLSAETLTVLSESEASKAAVCQKLSSDVLQLSYTALLVA
jgi:hypothetical protein